MKYEITDSNRVIDMTEEEINTQFVLELRELLKKYNADISFSVGECSDTYGLYDEKMVISRRPNSNSWKEIDIKIIDGWSFSYTDLDN